MNKRFRFLILIIFLIFTVTPYKAMAEQIDQDEYKLHFEASGGDELYNYIPSDTKNILQNLNSSDIMENSFINLTFNDVLKATLELVKDNAKNPIRATSCILGIIIISALAGTFKLSIGENELSKVFSSISLISCATFLIVPIADVVTSGTETINSAFIFTTAVAPVMASVLTAMGKTITATSYSFTVVTSADLISALYANFLMPLIKALLSFVIVSPLSTQIKLTGFITFTQKAIKWVLGFTMTIFVFVLSLQSVFNSASDNIGLKATKFIINNSVPFVGGAISDTFSTVQSYIGLLKNGIGAFGVVTGFAFFLPILVNVALWICSCSICKMVCDILDLEKLSQMFDGVYVVLSMIMSVFCCSMVFVIVSSGIMLAISG